MPTTKGPIPDADEMTAEFREQFERLCAEQQEKTGVGPPEWRAGGRRSKAYPDKENRAWWLENGPQQVINYALWRDQIAALGWQLWTAPGGLPAVELALQVTFGTVPVKMAIDRVFVSPAGELAVVDLKSGSRKPDSNLQLGMYACGLEMTFGVRPEWGAYYMTREAALTGLVPLGQFSVDVVTAELELFNKAVENEIFIPHRGSHCNNCGVAKGCAAVGGEDARLYDPSHPDYAQGVT